MRQTITLIIGASMSGLACAAALRRRNIEFIIIEKQHVAAAPWRNHYDRLHLHTNRRRSQLPYKAFGKKIPRYPARQQVVDYLDDYQKEFNISPVFNTEAFSVKKEGNCWITETSNGTFKSACVIVATGPYGTAKPVSFTGMETFPGRILHSRDYRTGKDFAGQHVLVVGFGNSACEIAIDLYEQGAMPAMSVRSAVNVIPRDVLGIPVLELSILLSRLPPRVADTVIAPFTRWMLGDLARLGLRKMPYGPLEEIRRDGNAPVLDIGTIRLIRNGHVTVHGDIDFIEGRTICFKDGERQAFDAIVAGIGYHPDYAAIVETDQHRLTDLRLPANRQKYFGKDGLYFCGYWISPTGQIREIASDAKRIAADIAKKGTPFDG